MGVAVEAQLSVDSENAVCSAIFAKNNQVSVLSLLPLKYDREVSKIKAPFLWIRVAT